jgi:hypothetical protein
LFKNFPDLPNIKKLPISAENKRSFGFDQKSAELSAPTETVFCRVRLVVDLIIINYRVFFFKFHLVVGVEELIVNAPLVSIVRFKQLIRDL